MTAEESVALLLSFWREAQPGPRCQAFGDQPGEAPSSRVECRNCGGRGRTAKLRPCPACNARGWIVVDDYTGQEVGTMETGTIAQTRRVFCDACGGQGAHGSGRRCRRCEGRGYHELPVGRNERPAPRAKEDALDAALEALDATGSPGLWRAGSFAAVEEALSRMQPWARHRIYQSYVLGESDPEPDLLRILTALVRKAERGKIRVPSELRRWQEERDRPRQQFFATAGERNAAMRAAREQGASLSEVAKRFSVSKSTAARVCR